MEKYPLRTTYFSAPLLCSRHENGGHADAPIAVATEAATGSSPPCYPRPLTILTKERGRLDPLDRHAAQIWSAPLLNLPAPNSSPTTDDLSRTGSLTGSDGLAGKTASVTRALAIPWGETGLSSCQLTRRSL